MSRLVLCLILAAACAAPQEPASSTLGPPSEQPANAEAARDEPVCKEEAVTGSNMKRTVCRSESQTDRERDDAQHLMRRPTIQTRTGD